MIIKSLNRQFFKTITSLPIRQFSQMTSENVNKIGAHKSGWPLKHVIEKLEHYAPLSNAEKWDNVGLLMEPFEERTIKKIFLTNDLTVKVTEEAIQKSADLIISYHPPIFAPLKRIVQENWKGKIVSMCLAKGIAVYSPHTAWNCAPSGASLNNWLSKAFKPPVDAAKPIVIDPETKTGPGLTWSYPPTFNYKLSEVIEDIQKYIELPVHVAMGVDHSLDTLITSMACCAGSGASLLEKVKKTDVYVTGEMSHHELLNAQHQNITVILCNHSNTERGFLKHFKPILENTLQNSCEVIVSKLDKDPLETVFIK